MMYGKYQLKCRYTLCINMMATVEHMRVENLAIYGLKDGISYNVYLTFLLNCTKF